MWLHLLISPIVTVPIHPLAPDQFFGRYGLRPEDVRSLVDEGRVIPIIDCDIHRYAHPSRSYLRPLVSHDRAVSTATRSEISYFTLRDYEALQVEATRLVPAAIPRDAKDGILGTRADWMAWFGAKTGGIGFRKATIERLARLLAVDPDFADELRELSPSTRLSEIHFRAAAEIHPATKGLGGIYKLTDEVLASFAHRLIGASARVTESRLSHFFSVIARDLGLAYPETLSFRAFHALLDRDATTIAHSLTMALIERVRNNRLLLDVRESEVLEAWKEVAALACRLEESTSDVFNLTFDYALSLLNIPAFKDLVRACGRLAHLNVESLDDAIDNARARIQDAFLRRTLTSEEDVIWLAFRYRRMVNRARRAG
jgi:hypothetical protein